MYATHATARTTTGKPMHPRDVLAAAVRCHQVPVWRYLRTLGCSADLADDMTQEAFLVAFDNGLRDATSQATARYLRSTARFSASHP